MRLNKDLNKIANDANVEIEINGCADDVGNIYMWDYDMKLKKYIWKYDAISKSINKIETSPELKYKGKNGIAISGGEGKWENIIDFPNTNKQKLSYTDILSLSIKTMKGLSKLGGNRDEVEYDLRLGEKIIHPSGVVKIDKDNNIYVSFWDSECAAKIYKCDEELLAGFSKDGKLLTRIYNGKIQSALNMVVDNDGNIYHIRYLVESLVIIKYAKSGE
mgnify:CR=1 FL=1